MALDSCDQINLLSAQRYSNTGFSGKIRYTTKQKDAILLYSHNGDVLLNGYLRNNYHLNDSLVEYYHNHYNTFIDFIGDFASDSTQYIEDYIVKLYVSLLSTFVLNYDEQIILYRGIREDLSGISKNIPKESKKSIRANGFMSTTCDIDVAREFAGSTGTLFILTIPPHFKLSAVYLNSKYADEHEFLLPHYTIMTITNIKSEQSENEHSESESKIKEIRTVISATVHIDLSFLELELDIEEKRKKVHEPNHKMIGLTHKNIQSLLLTSKHLNFFDWWKRTQIVDEYDYENVLDYCQYPEVLDWWNIVFNGQKLSKKLKYSELAMDNASIKNNIPVLDWWLKNFKEGLKYSHVALDMASANGCMEALYWWKNSSLPMKYTENAVDLASKNNHINVLNWWFIYSRTHSIKMKYTAMALLYNVDWWKEHLIQKYRWV